MITIKIVETPQEIRRCYAVMKQLRLHLESEDQFIEQVQRQQKNNGFILACLSVNEDVKAVGGYRIYENLCDGHHLYIDDLVTAENSRSQGYGCELFDWILNQARKNNCQRLTLDSGVQRFDAHRFYLAKRMKIAGHHFSLDITGE